MIKPFPYTGCRRSVILARFTKTNKRLKASYEIKLGQNHHKIWKKEEFPASEHSLVLCRRKSFSLAWELQPIPSSGVCIFGCFSPSLEKGHSRWAIDWNPRCLGLLFTARLPLILTCSHLAVLFGALGLMIIFIWLTPSPTCLFLWIPVKCCHGLLPVYLHFKPGWLLIFWSLMLGKQNRFRLVQFTSLK